MAETKGGGNAYARRFVRQSSVIFASLIAAAFVGFLFRIFLARTLGTAGYGLFYSVLALVLIVGTFRDLSIGSSVVKYIPEFVAKKQNDKLKSSIVFYALVQVTYSLSMGLILVALSDTIAITFFGAPEASLVIKFLSGWFLFHAIFYVFKISFQGFSEMTHLSLLGFFETLSPFVFAVFIFWILGPSAANVGLAYFIGFGVTALFALVLFLKKHSNLIRTKTRISKPLIKELFAFALPVLIGGIAGMMLGQVNTLLLMWIRSLSDVGLYQAAYPAADLLLYLSIAIGMVLFPMTSELWIKRKRELIGQAMSSLIKFSFVFTIPAALIAFSFPNLVISLLFGSEYLAATVVLQILVINAVVVAILVVPERVILGIGRPGINTIILTTRACLIIIFNLILIPLFGATGLAGATLLSSLGGFILAIYFARKFVKFNIPLQSILGTLSGSLLTVLLVSILKMVIDLPPFAELFAVMVPSLLFYAVWILLTRTLDMSDLLLIENTLPFTKRLIRVAKKLLR